MGGGALAAGRPCGRDPRRRAATRAAPGRPVLHARRRRPSGDRQRQRRARVRAAAEVALAGVAETGDAEAASQAANLIGVLAETDVQGPTTSRGRAAFEAAVRADPDERGRGVQPRAHPAARTRRRDARGAGIGIGRAWACAAGCRRGRARDGVLRVLALSIELLDPRMLALSLVAALPVAGGRRRRREEQRRGEDAGPDSGAARARRRAARWRQDSRAWPARPRPPSPCSRRPRCASSGRRRKWCSSWTSPARCAPPPVRRARHGSTGRGKSFARSARRSKTSRPGSPGSPTAPCRTCFRPATSARSATCSRGASRRKRRLRSRRSASSRRASSPWPRFAVTASSRPDARFRTCVLVTDGEARTGGDEPEDAGGGGLTPASPSLAPDASAPSSAPSVDPAVSGGALSSRDGCRLVAVRVGSEADRIYGPAGVVEAQYRPDAAAASTLERFAEAARGSAFTEDDVDARRRRAPGGRRARACRRRRAAREQPRACALPRRPRRTPRRRDRRLADSSRSLASASIRRVGSAVGARYQAATVGAGLDGDGCRHPSRSACPQESRSAARTPWRRRAVTGWRSVARPTRTATRR